MLKILVPKLKTRVCQLECGGLGSAELESGGGGGGGWSRESWSWGGGVRGFGVGRVGVGEVGVGGEGCDRGVWVRKVGVQDCDTTLASYPKLSHISPHTSLPPLALPPPQHPFHTSPYTPNAFPHTYYPSLTPPHTFPHPQHIFPRLPLSPPTPQHIFPLLPYFPHT